MKLKIQRIPPNGSHIFVAGKIGTKKVLCLIDTGASKSVVDKKFISENFSNYKVIQTEHSTTGLGANYTNSEFVVIPEWIIGDFTLRNHKTGLLDLSVVNTAYTMAGLKPITIIIGGDILLKYQSVIDYKKKVLRLMKK
ncbi:MAG: retropepsin-like domain-containing protein [Chitinophagales bacterium]|nr:retropepsin-like domain-containing protein [Chitinophagales bacterium]